MNSGHNGWRPPRSVAALSPEFPHHFTLKSRVLTGWVRRLHPWSRPLSPSPRTPQIPRISGICYCDTARIFLTGRIFRHSRVDELLEVQTNPFPCILISIRSVLIEGSHRDRAMTPLRFQSLLKRIRWGGSRLGSVLQKPIGDEGDYAESWEFSDYGVDQSVVNGGPFDGKALGEIVSEFGTDLFGRHAGLDQSPLLVKFLDASDRLSVQVHPDDTLAELFSPGENGKTESWVIIDAEPGAVIYAGLKPGVDSVQLQEHLADGTVEECIHTIPVKAGDCVLIPAGTVHAIGEGILLAEVQQMSNITFRLHDWGRVGADGQPRELHITESLKCIDFTRGPISPVTPRPIVEFREDFDATYETVELINCPYFVLHRHRGSAPFAPVTRDRFHALMVLDGAGYLACGEDSFALEKGQSILVPAVSDPAQIVPDGEITVLDAFLPAHYAIPNRSSGHTSSADV